MNQRTPFWPRGGWLLGAILLLSACGASAPAVVPVTPTPLPPDPALERPTFTVAQGEIIRTVEFTGRATPVDLQRLTFRRDGRVNTVAVAAGDVVAAGQVIAELQQTEALDDLRNAEDGVSQAQRDLENARAAQQKEVRSREVELTRAREDLALLLPGGDNDLLKAAYQKLEDAEVEERTTRDDSSWTKTTAELGVSERATALADAQKAYSDAFWANDWVVRYGTDPDQPTVVDEQGRRRPNFLTDKQKAEFAEKFATAERAVTTAERAVEDADRTATRARTDEVRNIEKAGEKVTDARREVERLLAGTGNKEINGARAAVQQAELALEETRTRTLNSDVKRVEDAQRALERVQRRVEEGRIIAPAAGTVIALAISDGQQVAAFEPVVEIADPTNLEFSATLSNEQMRNLSEGQPAEVRLLTRPDLPLNVVIRQMPAPFGSGGSGAVQDLDQTTRFRIVDDRGLPLEAGVSVGRVVIVIERKEQALWLPPAAIRSFEGRDFVIIRQGTRERRAAIRTGITTEERVEILEGVQRGDIIVGQ